MTRFIPRWSSYTGRGDERAAYEFCGRRLWAGELTLRMKLDAKWCTRCRNAAAAVGTGNGMLNGE